MILFEIAFIVREIVKQIAARIIRINPLVCNIDRKCWSDGLASPSIPDTSKSMLIHLKKGG